MGEAIEFVAGEYVPLFGVFWIFEELAVVKFAAGFEVHYRVCCCEWIDVGFRFYCYDIYGEHGIGKLASSELSCMSSLGDDMAYDGECSVKLFGDAGPGAVCWPFFSRILICYWCRDFDSDFVSRWKWGLV